MYHIVCLSDKFLLKHTSNINDFIELMNTISWSSLRKSKTIDYFMAHYKLISFLHLSYFTIPKGIFTFFVEQAWLKYALFGNFHTELSIASESIFCFQNFMFSIPAMETILQYLVSWISIFWSMGIFAMPLSYLYFDNLWLHLMTGWKLTNWVQEKWNWWCFQCTVDYLWQNRLDFFIVHFIHI